MKRKGKQKVESRVALQIRFRGTIFFQYLLVWKIITNIDHSWYSSTCPPNSPPYFIPINSVLIIPSFHSTIEQHLASSKEVLQCPTKHSQRHYYSPDARTGTRIHVHTWHPPKSDSDLGGISHIFRFHAQITFKSLTPRVCRINLIL